MLGIINSFRNKFLPDKEYKQIPEDILSTSKCYEAVMDKTFINNMTISTIHSKSAATSRIDSLLNLTELRNLSTSNGSSSINGKHSSVFDSYLNEKNIKIIEIKRLPIKEIYVAKVAPLCIVECENIKTFFVKNLIFSEYNNPKTLESYLDLKFVFPLPETGYNHIELATILQNKGIRIAVNVIEEYIVNLNSHFNNDSIIEIKKGYKYKRAKSFILALVFLFVIISAVILVIIFKSQIFGTESFWLTILISVFLVVLVCGSAYLVYANVNFARNTVKEQLEYSLLESRARKYGNLEDLMYAWNRNVFFEFKLFLSLPVTMNYLQISFSVLNEYTMEHHEIRD